MPKLVGYSTALDMILTGKTLKADKAKKIGLVDLVVDPAALESVQMTFKLIIELIFFILMLLIRRLFNKPKVSSRAL